MQRQESNFLKDDAIVIDIGKLCIHLREKKSFIKAESLNGLPASFLFINTNNSSAVSESLTIQVTSIS